MTPEVAAAFIEALAQIEVVEKGRTATGTKFNYQYADLGDIVKASRPILAAAGFIARTPIHGHGDQLAVTVKFLHASGEEWDEEPLPFPYGVDAQATGSTITYYRRYALLAALGIAAGEPNPLTDPGDDDGAAGVPLRVPGFRSSVVAAIGKLDDAQKLQLRTWCIERGIPNVPAEMDQAQCEAVTEWILALGAEVG
jgi:hypothetical protein